MRFLYIASCIFLWNIALAASGIGSDRTPAASDRENLPVAISRRTKALEFYLAGLMENDPGKKADLLLESFALDPGSHLPLLVLMKHLERVPEKLPQIRARLETVRQRYPDDIFIAGQASRIDRLTGTAPSKILTYQKRVLSRKPADGEKNHFRQLALDHVDLLLKEGRETVTLPFEADDIRLQETAFLYYSIRSKRDRLLMQKTCADTELAKHKALLEKYTAKNMNDFRRHLAVLHVIKEPDMAFAAAGRFLRKNSSILAMTLYIECAANAGKLDILEEKLRHYRIFSADFCARMRFQCRIRRGEIDRAMEETLNLKDRREQDLRCLYAAQVKRDIPALLRIIKKMESELKPDRNVITGAKLHTAELTRDQKLLREAAKDTGDKKWKDPVLANSLGYVSAVLGVDLDEAHKLLSFALSSDHHNTAYLDSMAWVQYKRKNYRSAWEYMLRAFNHVDHTISGAVMAYHAGAIQLALGNRQKALDYFQMALDIYNSNRTANYDLDVAELNKTIKSLSK